MIRSAAVSALSFALSFALVSPLRGQAPGHPHASAPGGEAASTLAWRAGPALAVGRDHHATFVVETPAGAWLYVAGGLDYGKSFGDTWRARLRADGTAGPWESAEALPAPRAGSGVAVADGRVVLTGGFHLAPGPEKVADTYVAAVRPDGALGPWTPSLPLPTPLYHHAAASHGGWVYVTGGQGPQGAEAAVYGARPGPDGTIREWVALTPMAHPRSHHASFVHEGHLYVVGGLAGQVNLPLLQVDVSRAEIREDGTLGVWQRVGYTPHALGTHSAFTHGGHLYLVGGVEDNVRFVDTVWRAPLAANGAVGAWEALAPGLPFARGHVHNTPVWNGRIYTVGGSNMRRVRGDLHIGTPIR